MELINKIVKEFVPKYPIKLFKILGIAQYNRDLNIFGFRINVRLFNILILIIITIFMIFSYELNNNQTTLIVWCGFLYWIIFMVANLISVGFFWYNNYRIKKLCKKYGFTIKQWNNAVWENKNSSLG